MEHIRRVLSVIVLNEDGVLSRISGLFAGRGYNIDSLTVAPIPKTNLSRLTIVTSGSAPVLEQIVKQLHKLIPTYKVIESGQFVEKEMALVKKPVGLILPYPTVVKVCALKKKASPNLSSSLSTFIPLRYSVPSK